MSVQSALQTLLVDPDEFFRDRMDDPSLKGPIVVVTITALLGALAAVVQNQVLVSIFEATLDSANASNGSSAEFGDAAIQAFLIFTYAITLIGPFVMWLIFAGVFHGISAVFDGEGSFSATLAAVGWGRVPSIFGAATTLVINYYQFEVRGIDVPENVTAENVQRFVQQVQSTEVVLLSTSLTILFTLWAAYLWVYGLKHARDLTRRQAVLTVAAPVLVSLLLTARGLLTAL